jgi:hypothetical protein
MQDIANWKPMLEFGKKKLILPFSPNTIIAGRGR